MAKKAAAKKATPAPAPAAITGLDDNQVGGNSARGQQFGEIGHLREHAQSAKPPAGDGRGDKDPVVFEWYCVNDPAEAKRRYIGRVVMGELVTEKFIDNVNLRGAIPDRHKTRGWKVPGSARTEADIVPSDTDLTGYTEAGA